MELMFLLLLITVDLDSVLMVWTWLTFQEGIECVQVLVHLFAGETEAATTTVPNIPPARRHHPATVSLAEGEILVGFVTIHRHLMVVADLAAAAADLAVAVAADLAAEGLMAALVWALVSEPAVMSYQETTPMSAHVKVTGCAQTPHVTI